MQKRSGSGVSGCVAGHNRVTSATSSLKEFVGLFVLFVGVDYHVAYWQRESASAASLEGGGYGVSGCAIRHNRVASAASLERGGSGFVSVTGR